MPNARVFGLRKVYINQVQNITDNNFASWPESATYGYYGGGYNLPFLSSFITRLDFSNETVSDLSNKMPVERKTMTATSSNSYGYFGGGDRPPINTKINLISRLDFTNETVSNPGKNLLRTLSRMAGLSGGASIYRSKGFKTYGYFCGGSVPGTASTVSRVEFSTETVSLSGNNLPLWRQEGSGLSNNNYGYVAGGVALSPPFDTSTVLRLDFSNEVVSDPGNRLSLLRRFSRGGVSSNSYGYIAGSGPGGGYNSIITRLDFSTEISNNLTNNLSENTGNGVSSVSTNTYGYFRCLIKCSI